MTSPSCTRPPAPSQAIVQKKAAAVDGTAGEEGGGAALDFDTDELEVVVRYLHPGWRTCCLRSHYSHKTLSPRAGTVPAWHSSGTPPTQHCTPCGEPHAVLCRWLIVMLCSAGPVSVLGCTSVAIPIAASLRPLRPPSYLHSPIFNALSPCPGGIAPFQSRDIYVIHARVCRCRRSRVSGCRCSVGGRTTRATRRLCS